MSKIVYCSANKLLLALFLSLLLATSLVVGLLI